MGRNIQHQYFCPAPLTIYGPAIPKAILRRYLDLAFYSIIISHKRPNRAFFEHFFMDPSLSPGT